MPSASIILVTYNSADFIGDCLRALKKTTGINDAEVIVWDNASQDETVKIVSKIFSKANLHESRENLGFAKAVNRAAQTANGKYIILLNPDTQVAKNWLKPLLSTFKKNKTIGAVNSKTKILIDGTEFIQNAGNHIFHDGYSRDRGAVVTQKREQFYEEESTYYNTAREIPACSGVSLAIPRKLFLELGGFDEHMFMYYEDTDFSLRLKKAGYTVWYQPKSELTHIHSASSEEWSDFFVYNTELNRLLFLWKHFPLLTVWRETARYKLSTAYAVLRQPKRAVTRIKVLLKLTISLPYLLSYRFGGTS